MNNIITFNGKNYRMIKTTTPKCNGCVFQRKSNHIGCNMQEATEECVEYIGADRHYYIFVNILPIKKLKIL